MSLQYIIDGYNVIRHSCYSPAKSISDEKKALADFITSRKLCGSRKNSITIVFDGYADGLEAMQCRMDVQMLFGREESADEKIKKLVEANRYPKNIIVVSDDKEIRFAVRGCGARVLSVEEFVLLPHKEAAAVDKEAAKKDLNYTQMDKITKELKRIWLK